MKNRGFVLVQELLGIGKVEEGEIPGCDRFGFSRALSPILVGVGSHLEFISDRLFQNR